MKFHSLKIMLISILCIHIFFNSCNNIKHPCVSEAQA